MTEAVKISETTNNNNKNEACHAALAVTELLEWILFSLPTKDLLLAQRVAQPWRDLINSSPRLQEALFLRPTPIAESWAMKTTPYGSHDDRDPAYYEPCSEEEVNEEYPDYELQCMVPVVLNKLLCQQHDGRVERILDGEICEEGENIELLSISDTNASCMDMLLCQPPATYVEISVFNPASGITHDCGIEIVDGVLYRHIVSSALDLFPAVKDFSQLKLRDILLMWVVDISMEDDKEIAVIRKRLEDISFESGDEGD